MKKKFLSVSLVLALTLSPVLGAEEGPSPLFSDVERGSWYEDGVRVCAEQGVMVGTGEGKFSPGDTLSRAECLALALRLYDLRNGGDGTFETAPEGWWGDITLTFPDGSQQKGHMNDEAVWTWSLLHRGDMGHLGFCLDQVAGKDQDWFLALDYQPVTLRFRGQDCPGTLHFAGPAKTWLYFEPDSFHDFMHVQYVHFWGNEPHGWSLDVVYTAHQLGLTDPEQYPTLCTLTENVGGISASRLDFALALYEVAGDLPQRFQVTEILDVDPDYHSDSKLQALRSLYGAGVLTGVDEYGTLGAGGTLTRAEAAVMVARVLDESLRVSEPPLPLPDKGYSLTYLMDGTPDCGVKYPVCVMRGFDDQSGGALTIDGRFISWEEMALPGHLHSSGLERSGEYCRFHCVDDTTWTSQTALMDREGNFPVPLGVYKELWPTPDGYFIGTKAVDPNATPVVTRWFLLEPGGTVVQELPQTVGTPDNTWRRFSEGLCPWREENTWEVNMGYADQTGAWAVQPVYAWTSPFYNGRALLQNKDGLCGVMDRQGVLVLPFRYSDLELLPNSPGFEGGYAFYFTKPDGTFGYLRPDLTEVTVSYWWGTYQNGYFEDHGIYRGLDGKPLTQKFDWTGPIGPDGRGFVGLDGKIYRIEF